jgi:hypothetical protein
LAVVPADGRLLVGGGRPLATAATEAEAKLVREVVTAFGFDTVCRLGAGARGRLGRPVAPTAVWSLPITSVPSPLDEPLRPAGSRCRTSLH